MPMVVISKVKTRSKTMLTGNLIRKDRATKASRILMVAARQDSQAGGNSDAAKQDAAKMLQQVLNAGAGDLRGDAHDAQSRAQPGGSR